MRKKLLVLFAAGVMATSLLAGCSCSTKTPVKPEGDITFSDLQTNYAILVECYNQVESLYMNKQIKQDDQVENLMGEAKKVIDEMGQLQESDFKSQDDYKKMNDSMVTMIESLGKIVDQMQVVE